jgi:hypothetical protein
MHAACQATYANRCDRRNPSPSLPAGSVESRADRETFRWGRFRLDRRHEGGVGPRARERSMATDSEAMDAILDMIVEATRTGPPG